MKLYNGMMSELGNEDCRRQFYHQVDYSNRINEAYNGMMSELAMKIAEDISITKLTIQIA